MTFDRPLNIRRAWRPRYAVVLLAFALAGCGTTRWSDTTRTATEQMLISDAVDRAVSEMDFSAIAGETVFVDTRYMIGTTDERYLISTLRQHLLASGCTVAEQIETAKYVAEVRTGAVGTNRHDLLFGVPATNLPSGGGVFPGPASIPEVSLMKRTAQHAVCKVAVFAYERESGRPVWQSGNHQVVSRAKDVWVFGAGPFQQGTIYDGTKLAGERLQVPLASNKKSKKKGPPPARVAQEMRFPKRPAEEPWRTQPGIHENPPPRMASRPGAPSAAPPAASGGPSAIAPAEQPKPSALPSTAPLAPPPGTVLPWLPPGVAPPPVPAGPQAGSSNATSGAIGAAGMYDWARTFWAGSKP